jgi:cyanophycinase-like exopeptidase
MTVSSGSFLGTITLFGSGETGKHGRLIQERLLSRHQKPVRIAILETPAGFQPNVDVVTGKLRGFYEHNLQNLRPIVTVVPARARGGPLDPDDPAIAALFDDADAIVAGPGSPTYVVRQLAGTATLASVRRRLELGSTAVFASAAAIAFGHLALPVYEIFKVGEDPRWVPGLDVLGGLGLRVAVVPHWNNREGGDDLDTSRCFAGERRFEDLLSQLPLDVTILGIDEHTAVILDPVSGEATVQGAGTATTISDGEVVTLPSGTAFPLTMLSGLQRSIGT